jgi:hypothetical protein
VDLLFDHTKWNFLNEKHIGNKDALPTKGKADPLTGYIYFIPPVTRNFRESNNIFAIISGNPAKPAYLVQYKIDKENGMAETFVHVFFA